MTPSIKGVSSLVCYMSDVISSKEKFTLKMQIILFK